VFVAALGVQAIEPLYMAELMKLAAQVSTAALSIFEGKLNRFQPKLFKAADQGFVNL
jgi:hypothetical protein